MFIMKMWISFYSSTAYFYIKSEMNGKVVDIPKGDDSPGVKPVMWDQGDGQDHQLWYEDSSGNILSKLNDFCLDASSRYPTWCGKPMTSPRGRHCNVRTTLEELISNTAMKSQKAAPDYPKNT